MLTKIAFVAVGIALGMLVAFLWRIIFDRGHSVYGVKSRDVQQLVSEVVRGHTGLRRLHTIDTGGTHQEVLSGGTVIAYFDRVPGIGGLPRNARSFVVWGRRRRHRAVHELVIGLRNLGYKASDCEPLSDFPKSTFIMVTSDAFEGCAIAFRPHWIRMAFLDARARRAKRKLSHA